MKSKVLTFIIMATVLSVLGFGMYASTQGDAHGDHGCILSVDTHAICAPASLDHIEHWFGTILLIIPMLVVIVHLFVYTRRLDMQRARDPLRRTPRIAIPVYAPSPLQKLLSRGILQGRIP